jgi:F0F1-type ATP synthase assembly protein I
MRRGRDFLRERNLEGPDPKYDWFRQTALLTGIPLVLMLGPACGYFIGHYADLFFNTDPWLMVVFTVMGGVSGVREMIRLIKRANDHE